MTAGHEIKQHQKKFQYTNKTKKKLLFIHRLMTRLFVKSRMKSNRCVKVVRADRMFFLGGLQCFFPPSKQQTFGKH